MEICWLGHASFRIESDRVVYIDPYQVTDDKQADLILITHGHYDHCDNDSVSNIRNEDTTIVTTGECQGKFSGDVRALSPRDSTDTGPITVRAVHAYNINKAFHPKGSGLGFIVEMEGKRIYHAGDTDFIPEMKDLKDITVALLPVGGTYTMNGEEAVEAVKTINPEISIPMHYGSVAGSLQDAKQFKEKVEAETETKVEILEEGSSITV